jgi:hypothetical protein
MLPKILLLDSDPHAAALLAFVNRLSGETTKQEKFKWTVDTWLPTTDTVRTTATSSATTIPVDNADYYLVNEQWMNSDSGEHILITAVDVTNNTVTAIRGIGALNSEGGTAAAEMTDGNVLVKIAPAIGENSSRQGVLTTVESEVYNYCQYMRWELSMSQRQQKREFQNGADLPHQQMKILKEARMALQRMFMSGQRAKFNNSEGEQVTATNGLQSVISTNSLDVSGILYENALDTYLAENVFRYGSMQKVLFASQTLMLAFSQMGKGLATSNLDLTDENSGIKLGMTVSEYLSPEGGTLKLVHDRFLTNTQNGNGYVADMSSLKKVMFTNNGISGDLHIVENTGDADDMGFTQTLIGDMGLKWGNEENLSEILNVTGGAAGSAP